MSHRYLAAVVGLAAVIVLAARTAGPVVGQEATAAPEGWTSPQTPWGNPDLQGIWSPRLHADTPRATR